MASANPWIDIALVYCLGKSIKENKDLLDVVEEFDFRYEGGIYIPSILQPPSAINISEMDED